MAGGLRLGVRMDDPALLVAPGGDPGHEAAPAVACWEGRILATGPRNDLLQAIEGSGYPIARFARVDAGGGTVTPGPHRPAHPSPLRRVARGRARAPPARRRLPRDPPGGRRDPVDRRGDPRCQRRAARGAWPALAGRDARPRDDDHRGQVRLRARPADGAAPPRDRLRARQGRARRRPADVARGARRGAGVPRSPGRHGGVRAPSPRGAAARRRGAGPGALRGRVLRARRVQPGAVTAHPARRRPGSGWRSRLHADELAPSGGAELAAEIGALSADHLAVPSDAGVDALAAAAAAGPPGRRGRAAGDDVVPDARRGRAGAAVHRARASRSPSRRTSIPGRRRRRACRS